MFDLKNLENAKQQTHLRKNSGQETYNELYREAIGFLKNYTHSQNSNINVLKSAAEKLLEAIKIVKRKPEPFLYLSYIFYILGDSGLSQKYLKICNMIDPHIDGIDKLKKILILERSANKTAKSSHYINQVQQISRFNKN